MRTQGHLIILKIHGNTVFMLQSQIFLMTWKNACLHPAPATLKLKASAFVTFLFVDVTLISFVV